MRKNCYITPGSIGLSEKGASFFKAGTLAMEMDGKHWYSIIGLNPDDPEDRQALIASLKECGILTQKGKANSFSGKLTIEDLELYLLWLHLIGRTNYRFYKGFTIKLSYEERIPKKFQNYRDNLKKKPAAFQTEKVVEKLKAIFPDLGEVPKELLWMMVEKFVTGPAYYWDRYNFLSTLLRTMGATSIRPDYTGILSWVDHHNFREKLDGEYNTKATCKNTQGNMFFYALIDKTRYVLQYVMNYTELEKRASLHSGDKLNEALREKYKSGLFTPIAVKIGNPATMRLVNLMIN